ncbi:Up-regulated during septation-domain-containing protein [Microdochium trichocladiopsis]|uniref:Up-regulated during septation-domain-containing protein n=1 Tax=Microdochium trichocladiopsis TaxID=1682393 RepID=A0A9P8Y2X2_9PEZI|nr:Up-regulated during septation-domain-containing protein [Microdochium trichocladiopsis]KAH7026212.1 Up-regulated during septation-domain-containing protein [Microdochium trichocladiopsis]
MAHIVSCMANISADHSPPREYIVTHIAAQMSTDSVSRCRPSLVDIHKPPILTPPNATQLASVSSGEERKSFVWRMQQPEIRKYQLFPTQKQLPTLAAGKPLDVEQLQSAAQVAVPDKTEKTSLTSGLRSRIKEHNLNRRRKVSVPELGPMTTVQEVAMDSPTIPGRPALHERSMSSPVGAGRYQSTEEAQGTSGAIPRSVPVLDTTIPRAALSPKDLAPLVIPLQGATLPTSRQIVSPPARSRAGTTPQDQSMRTVTTPFTPMTASTIGYTPRSAMTTSTMPTPISAPADARSSPEPWGDKQSTATVAVVAKPSFETLNMARMPSIETLQQGSASALSSHGRSGSASVLPFQNRTGSAAGHRRNQSDTGSIMERGRPRKRADGTLISGKAHKRSSSRQSRSAERRAFEELPLGWKPSDARHLVDAVELDQLQRQAEDQAVRFDVLRKDDVDRLSQELRRLDERTDYLRRTYTSLRAGRRNLHSRICQYLRSSRGSAFSQEALLKQEEALAELDASIDDWVSKLEHAENRRTRVRQKLLEHVAAAVTLGPAPRQDARTHEAPRTVHGANVLPMSATDLSTPPRSPNKETFLKIEASPSPSPQRVVARVPSVIPEEADSIINCRLSAATIAQNTLERMESIRIYADSDVYELLADVESEFTKLNGTQAVTPQAVQSPQFDAKRKELHRARSHELLNGSSKLPATSTSPTIKPLYNATSAADDSCIILSSAVFQPQRSQTPNF